MICLALTLKSSVRESLSNLYLLRILCFFFRIENVPLNAILFAGTFSFSIQHSFNRYKHVNILFVGLIASSLEQIR